MDAVRPGGSVMLFASTQHGEAPFDPAAVCMDEKTLMGRTRRRWRLTTRWRNWCFRVIATAAST